MLAHDFGKDRFPRFTRPKSTCPLFCVGCNVSYSATGKKFLNFEFDEKEQRPKKSATGDINQFREKEKNTILVMPAC